MFEKIKNFDFKTWAVNWLLQKKLVEVVKDLDGNKTYLGYVTLLVQIVLLAYKPDDGWYWGEALTHVKDTLVGVGAASPLTEEDTGLLVSSAIIVIGILDKIRKSVVGLFKKKDDDLLDK